MDSGMGNRNYELAYHLNSDIEEQNLMSYVQEMEKIVTESGGSILVSREPKRKHLSYPVKQKNYAYFGILDFNAQPDSIEKINSQMKLQNHIIRHLLIQKPIDEKNMRILGTERQRPKMKTHEPAAINEAEKAKKEEAKPGQIEKEIEDVLEKI